MKKWTMTLFKMHNSQIASSKLQPRRTHHVAPQKTVFDHYSEVPALFVPTKRPGEALRLFRKARDELEEKLTDSYDHIRRVDTGTKNSKKDSRQDLPQYHALLALVLWLHPNHSKLNRMDQASSMFNHASAAVVTSSNPADLETLAIGLLVQLRILPFLVRSKKAEETQLAKVREIATALAEQMLLKRKATVDSPLSDLVHVPLGVERKDIAALLLDGLGFSYFQFERNAGVATSFLSQAIEHLLLATKEARAELRRNQSPSVAARVSFLEGMNAVAYWDQAASYDTLAEGTEGDEMLSFVHLTRTNYQKASQLSRRTPWHIYTALSLYNEAGTFARESEYQFETSKARACMKRAVRLGEEALEYFRLWSSYEADFMGGSWVAAFCQKLATLSDWRSKKNLMKRSLVLARRAEALISGGRTKYLRYTAANVGDIFLQNAVYYKDVASKDLRKEKSPKKEKELVAILRKALASCLKSRSFFREERYNNRSVEALFVGGDICYEMMQANTLDMAQKSYYARLAKRQCNNAIRISSKLNWNERVAESCWRLAQIFDREGRFEDSASQFLKAYESYDAARKSVEHGRVFEGLVNYMLAWNKIELAKAAHRSSNFAESSNNYLEAARLVAATKRWGHMTSLFKAESLIDLAEAASLEDKAQEAIDDFSKAIESLSSYSIAVKNLDVPDQYGAETATLLTTFCRARMILEKSKEDYRIGNVDQSIRGLDSAEKMFRDLAGAPSVRSDPLRANELESLSSLCKAMKSFQKAQVEDDPQLYLNSKEIFETASETSRSKALKPLLSGLGQFSSFLFFSKRLENSLDSALDPELIVSCDEALEHAEVMFRKVGNRSFLAMLRASKHILDATIKMNAAEREIEDAETRTRLYQQAQRALSAASRYYSEIGSSKRVKESLKMIGAVRNHQSLIPLAHDIMAEVTSNQIIYSAIASSSAFEQTAGESASAIDNSYLEIEYEVNNPYVTSSNEALNLSIAITNLGKKAAIAVRIDEIIPEGFEIGGAPYVLSQSDRSLKLNVKIDPSKSKSFTVSAKALRVGDFTWHPSLIYMDAERNYRISRAQTARAVIEPLASLDLRTSLVEKSDLEKKLQDLEQRKASMPEDQRSTAEYAALVDQGYALREKITKIEEEHRRIHTEYESIKQDLERVRSDINSLRSKESEVSTRDDLAALEVEERLLNSKLEKRKRMIESAGGGGGVL